MVTRLPNLRTGKLILLIALSAAGLRAQEPDVDPPPEPAAATATATPPVANRSLLRRLLRGNKQRQLETIATLPPQALENAGILAALVQCADGILQDGGPDTRVYLTVEKLGMAPEHEVARAALLRWLTLAVDQQPEEPPHEWQMLAHALLVALRQYAHQDVQARASQLLDSDDVRLKMLAVDVLGRNRYEPALPRLIELLDTDVYRRDYAFRYSLIEALAHYRQPQAGAALADQLPKLSGQLRQVLQQYLDDRAQNDRQLPRTLQVDNRPLRGRDAEAKADADADAGLYLTDSAPEYPLGSAQPDYRVPRFMGVPIYADRVTFVIDFSSTMAQPSGRGGTRLSAAKRELQEAILQLAQHQAFRVVGFDTHVVPLSPTLVPATPENKALLAHQLDYLNNGRGTNLYGGLHAALTDPTHPELVILLSDGLPTRGEFLRDNEILRAIGYTNLFRRITIATIAVGRRSGLMEQLARQNGGTTRRIN
jgi:hypothetical protein